MNTRSSLPFTERLLLYRRRAGLTQAQLASSIGCALGTLIAWERGDRSPRVDQLEALARALEVATQDLLA